MRVIFPGGKVGTNWPSGRSRPKWNGPGFGCSGLIIAFSFPVWFS